MEPNNNPAEKVEASEQQDEMLETLARAARHAAKATARQGSYLRGMYYHARVGQHLGHLTIAEQERAHRFCGFLSVTGWHILDRTMALVNGDEKVVETVDPKRPLTVYAPRMNYGGWVRIFRLKAAALPRSPQLLDALVDQWMSMASLDSDHAAEVKGIFGLSPISPVEPGPLREAILNSDLYNAPWMVAIWRPDTKWVIWGCASRYLQNQANRTDSNVQDLFTRVHADQTFVVDEYGLIPPRTGPQVGIEQVVEAVDYAFQVAARLDIVLEPIENPIETWEDGVPGFTEVPLMGVLIQTVATSWLVSFIQNAERRWWIYGLTDKDFEAFHSTTGVNPAAQLQHEDFEMLVRKGIGIYGWVTKFTSVASPLPKNGHCEIN